MGAIGKRDQGMKVAWDVMAVYVHHGHDPNLASFTLTTINRAKVAREIVASAFSAFEHYGARVEPLTGAGAFPGLRSDVAEIVLVRQA